MSSEKILFVDTDVLIDILHENINYTDLESSFSKYDQLATTSANIYELYFGYYQLEYSKHKISKKKLEKEKSELDILTKNLIVYNMTGEAAIKSAEIYHALISQGRQIENFDCIIAGIILTSPYNDLLTRNINHYKRIKGLNLLSLP